MLQDARLIASVVAGAVAGEGLCELEGVVGGAVCERVDGHIIVGNHVGKQESGVRHAVTTCPPLNTGRRVDAQIHSVVGRCLLLMLMRSGRRSSTLQARTLAPTPTGRVY